MERERGKTREREGKGDGRGGMESRGNVSGEEGRKGKREEEGSKK